MQQQILADAWPCQEAFFNTGDGSRSFKLYMPMTLKRSFSPVIDAHVHTLILGSLPGERSLADQQYYAHPQNKFWSLMSEIISEDLVILSYAQRLETLLKHHTGLWDVVAEANRTGSLDSKIRDHLHNDLIQLTDSLPELHTIGFNGGTAARLGIKALADRASRYRLVTLPSSSPAYTKPYAEKIQSWLQLKPGA